MIQQHPKRGHRHASWSREFLPLTLINEASVIKDHNLLMTIFKKHIVSLAHRLQIILQYIHQYNMRILYKPGPQLLIADWLYRHNNRVKKEKMIPGMGISINVIETCTDIPDCMIVEDMWLVTTDGEHKSMLSNYVWHDWPPTKAEIQKSAAIVVFQRLNNNQRQDQYERKKNRNTYIIQEESFYQLDVNYMGIEKMRLLECESI